jgi:hypothetical protein
MQRGEVKSGCIGRTDGPAGSLKKACGWRCGRGGSAAEGSRGSPDATGTLLRICGGDLQDLEGFQCRVGQVESHVVAEMAGELTSCHSVAASCCDGGAYQGL